MSMSFTALSWLEMITFVFAIASATEAFIVYYFSARQ